MCCEEESTADSETPNLRGRFLLSINDETELFDSFFTKFEKGESKPNFDYIKHS